MLKDAKCIVFKVGTSTLTHKTGKTNLKAMEELVEVLADLMNSGRRIVLVTSGAIGVGVGKLGLPARPTDTAGKQAAATVGQCELMFMYDKMFSEYDHKVAQLLITKSDVDNEERCLNLINTFDTLFHYNTIPIINENDSVAVEEIVYGDNDSLSAIVARLIGADILIILTDTDGLFSADPAIDPDAELIPVVDAITPDIIALAGGAGSSLGTGGMATKVHAAQIATRAGIDTVVMNGNPITNIYDLFDGKPVGTLFKAANKC